MADLHLRISIVTKRFGNSEKQCITFIEHLKFVEKKTFYLQIQTIVIEEQPQL